jgi:DNA repair exonuclease SbcCD nuclease subunit
VKFLHAADLHFGAGRQVFPDYLRRQVRALRTIYRTAEQYNVDCVVLAGDIFDRSNVFPPERDAFLKELLRADKRGFTTLLVDGNHDVYQEGYSNIHFLRVLYEHRRFRHTIVADRAPEWVTVAGQPFLLFPWHKDAGRELVKLTRKARPLPVVALHLALKGARADNGYRLPSGDELNTERIRACYIALGDLHLKQRPLKHAPHMWYCGAPIQHDFGEQLPKGCLIVDPAAPTTPQFVAFDLHPQLVTITSLAEQRKADPHDLLRLVTSHVVERGADFPANIVKLDYRFDPKSVKTLQRRVRGKADEVRESPLFGLEQILREVAGLEGRPLKLALKRGYSYFNTLVRAGL